jgi:glycosyltransferase involved in cell wall biosynthesis
MVHPAPSDNLPNVVVEAMAMELPTLAFPVGGLPEMIQPGITGWLCESVGADAMRVALESALGQIQEGVSLGENCRQFVEDKFTVEGQSRSYLELFDMLLQTHSDNRT